jgi:phosphorylcholine metabolism protein LicD
MEFSNQRDIEKARTVLIDVTDFLDEHKIPYCLEAGTLLGMLRDRDIIPWDHDIDISISIDHASDLNKVRW